MRYVAGEEGVVIAAPEIDGRFPTLAFQPPCLGLEIQIRFAFESDLDPLSRVAEVDGETESPEFLADQPDAHEWSVERLEIRLFVVDVPEALGGDFGWKLVEEPCRSYRSESTLATAA